jgi:hypothetical protein
MDPALACRSAMGCAQVPSHLVLDPFTRGATASVLDTWTAIWKPTILWGLSTEPGVEGKLAWLSPA